MPLLVVQWIDEVVQIPFDPGRSLLSILNEAGIPVRVGCNETGTCGLCQVRIESGEAGETTLSESIHLDKDQLADGIRLACQIMPVNNLQCMILSPSSRLIWKKLDKEAIGTMKAPPPVRLPDIPRTVKNPCGVAVDLGTTHIKLSLYDLSSGRRITGRYGLNPQITNGSDVMTRLIVASESNTQAGVMTRQVIEAIGEALWNMAINENIELSQIVRCIIVGNTAMLALLSGRNFQQLLQPECWMTTLDCLPDHSEHWVKNWGIHPRARIAVIPPLAGFIGSDLLAGLLSTKLTQTKKVSLLIDFGTNSEIALWDGRTLWVTSAAGGPAFEGNGITCGFPAEPGAVYQVNFMDDGILDWKAIGDIGPRGLCGSGLVDLIANLVQSGILTNKGIFSSTVHHGAYTILIGEREITITKGDVDIFQRAKAAIGTGIQIVLSRANLGYGDLQRICIGGSFGRYINISNAQEIGLLPGGAHDLFELGGNTALSGCEEALLSTDALEDLLSLKNRVKMVNLAQEIDFNDFFLDNLYLQPL